MAKIELLQYVKSWNPNSAIPADVMTMGELAETLEKLEEAEEGMRLMLSIGEVAHPVDEAQAIEREIDSDISREKWDFTPVQNMPIIDFGSIPEIPF